MAEILLDKINVISTSEVVAKSIRIISAESIVSSGASVSGLVVRIQYAGGALSAKATTTSTAHVIKYVKTGLAGIATTKVSGHKYKTVNGALIAKSSVDVYYSDRDIKGEMHDYLPRYYEEFDEVETLVKSGANESVRLRAKLAEVLDQFYVDSASYGLNRWRGIADIDDVAARSAGSQRDFINAKLRGVGTVTPAHLKTVVDAFYESEIIEDIGAYKVGLKLVGKRGEPRNLEDIRQAVDSVIPAHLAHYFEFTYLPWSEVSEALLTWEQAEEFTAIALEEAFLLPGGEIK